MKYTEYGTSNKEVIILLHGGGLAPWNYYKEAALLKEKYHIILPILDGHNGSDRDFTSIEENARSVITYIDTYLGGKVLLIGGLSLGGQILLEILSQRVDICKFALIESALALAMPTTTALIKPTLSLSYRLIPKRWFAKLQFAALHMNPCFFEMYFKDSVSITKENMIAFLLANANYQMKHSLTNCQTKTLILVGEKEHAFMKRSAKIIHESIPVSSLEIMSGYYHGELSINHPQIYTEKVYQLIESL